MTTVREGDLLWSPSEERKAQANITRYMAWLRESRGLSFTSYEELWRWSVDDLEAFWGSVWEYFGVRSHKPYVRVLADRSMPGARWFTGAEINYAEHALERRDGHVALLYRNEDGDGGEVTYAELACQVASVAAGLRRLGVGRGDRVAAYLPNIPEAVVALLATASIGAVWSSCSPDFGERSVVDRFQQIEPTALITVDGYRYGGREFDRTGVSEEIRRSLPSLKAMVVVENIGGRELPEGAVRWEDLLGEDAEPVFEPVPFDHPLWVLFSSGTTGLPKAVVQSQGGILVEHLKALSLHLDLTEHDRFFWFSTTGWMMWNFLAGGLLLGSTCILYDGNPGHPDLNALWRLAQDTGMTYFGTSAPFIAACMKAGIEPGRDFDLSTLRAWARRRHRCRRRASRGCTSTSSGTSCWARRAEGRTCARRRRDRARSCRCTQGSCSAHCWASSWSRTTRPGDRGLGAWGSSSSRSRCRRCPSSCGATQTGAGTWRATSGCTRAPGGTATG